MLVEADVSPGTFRVLGALHPSRPEGLIPGDALGVWHLGWVRQHTGTSCEPTVPGAALDRKEECPLLCHAGVCGTMAPWKKAQKLPSDW